MVRSLIIFSAAVLCAANLPADDSEGPIFLDPAKAGDDYGVQGEYKGTLMTGQGEIVFCLQVIALGENKFDAVGYAGGLPGDGWERGGPTIDATGRTKDGVTKLYGGDGSAVIKDGKMTIFSDAGDEVGKLTKVVRKSPTLGAKPPEGAVVLFDGSTADGFEGGEIAMEKYLLADCTSKETLGDHTLHVEFRTPFKPTARGQARGNSGVYIQSRYECQVLDTFGLSGKDNECGGIYSIAEPIVNACLPPLTWQTYDIDFTAAKWEGDKKTENARVTIRHNGILIHDDLELPNGTPGRLPEEAGPAPLYLQGHGNPVVYRNIWAVKK